MRHTKLIVLLVLLVVGTFVAIRLSGNDPSVRGQDANVETRGTNTAGLPIATSGSTDPAAGSSSGHDGRNGPAASAAGVASGGFTDGGFVAEAAEMNATETALADLAARNATDNEVKAFAAELLRDHKAAGEELKAMAADKQWAFPQSLDAMQQQALQALQRAHGPEFDRAFVDAMVTSHERAVAAFRNASASATDAGLRAFAQKQLPALEKHLTHARQLR